MDKLKKMIPYLIVQIIAFYLVPLIIKDTGSAMTVMLIWLPVITFVSGAVYGWKNSFNFGYPLIVAILFAPTIFIYYNYTAYIYIAIYGVIALIGNFIGKLFYKKK